MSLTRLISSTDLSCYEFDFPVRSTGRVTMTHLCRDDIHREEWGLVRRSRVSNSSALAKIAELKSKGWKVG